MLADVLTKAGSQVKEQLRKAMRGSWQWAEGNKEVFEAQKKSEQERNEREAVNPPFKKAPAKKKKPVKEENHNYSFCLLAEAKELEQHVEKSQGM